MRILVAIRGPLDPEPLAVFLRRYKHLFKAIDGSGAELHVALLGRSPVAAREIEQHVTGVHEIGYPSPPSARGAMYIPPIAARLRTLIRQVGPDLVEGSEPLPAIAASLAAKTCSKDVVTTYRRHHGAATTRGLRLASRLAARLADKTFVSNRPGAQRAQEEDRSPPEEVLITPSGAVDFRHVTGSEMHQARESLGIPPTSKVITAVCRMRPEKGIDVLIAAADRTGLEDLHLVVVGSGPELPKIEKMAQGAKAHVHVLGHRDDVALWFHLGDVVAIPSRRESFSRTVVEAMCAGKPVVASRVGGLVEAVDDGATGILIPPDDPSALANALGTLLRDERLLSTMALAARRRFEERYTMDAMAASWLTGWETALRSTRVLREAA